MRISDWSSDVCSSDLRACAKRIFLHRLQQAHDRSEIVIKLRLAVQVAGERRIAKFRQPLGMGLCVLAQTKGLGESQHARTRTRLVLIEIKKALHRETVGFIADGFELDRKSTRLNSSH